MKAMRILFFSILPFLVNAQPVLQESNFEPIGFSTTMMIKNSGYPGPGSAGANQFWNFSGVSTNAGPGTYAAGTPSSSACYSLFPGSNYAIFEVFHFFYNRSATKLELIGSANQIGCMSPSVFTDYRQTLKFPFNYLDSYTDTYGTSSSSSSATVTCDGYGTLVTPFATHNNVIRVVTTYSGSSVNSYAWYSCGNPSYKLMSDAGNGGTVMFYLLSGIGIEEHSNSIKINVYPNPNSNKVLNVNFEDMNSECEMEIVDVIGKNQLRSTLILKENKVDISDLKAGIYFYSLKNERGIFKTGKLVVE